MLKIIVLAVLIIMLVLLCLNYVAIVKRTAILGLEVVLSDVEQSDDLDEHITILFNGMPAPFDSASNTLYIPQNLEKRLWEGTLTADDPSCRLYFLADGGFKNKNSAVNSNHAFTLLARRNDQYRKYKVIFTSLPVIVIDNVNDFGDQEWHGQLWLFDPDDDGRYTVQTTGLDYHIRGATSQRYIKKSYKLSLKGAQGQNNDMNLLGINKDDDWILNSLYTDDEKIREKLVQDIWNAMADMSESRLAVKFAHTEYVELIIENQYKGLYALGPRIDAKYQGLSKQDTIVFRLNQYLPISEVDWLKVTEETQTVGPISIVSASDISAVWQTLHGFSRQYLQTDWPFDLETAVDMVDINNQIDIHLICQLAWLMDNNGAQNAFYIVVDNRFYRVLWDMDGSFGNHFTIDFTLEENSEVFLLEDRYETAYEEIVYMEMARLLEQDGSLWDKIRERYRALRSSVFDPQNITAYASEMKNTLIASGVLMRESQLYPDEKITWDAA